MTRTPPVGPVPRTTLREIPLLLAGKGNRNEPVGHDGTAVTSSTTTP